MKYIAVNDFPNPPGNPIVLGDGQKHTLDANGKELKNHIHKGAQFSIGSATEYKNLSPSDKTLVAQLSVSGKIAEAKPEIVSGILEEVKADAARAKADTAKAAVSDPLKVLADLVEKLPELMQQAAATAVANADKGKK
jgi:hypothetical protein